MNIKSVIKYELHDVRNALFIFYPLVYLVFIFQRVVIGNSTFLWSISYMEKITFTFLFISGIFSFGKSFRFCQANGVSRRELHKGFFIYVWIVAIGMAFIDNINAFIFTKVAYYNPLFFDMYSRNGNDLSDITWYLKCFLWSIFVYAFFYFIGYSISILYYKMSRNKKIAVTIGAPVILVILAFIDDWGNYYLHRPPLFYGLRDYVIPHVLGYYHYESYHLENPFIAIATIGLTMVILSLVNHLMIRRTELKN